jgi:hypothetical protein
MAAEAKGVQRGRYLSRQPLVTYAQQWHDTELPHNDFACSVADRAVGSAVAQVGCEVVVGACCLDPVAGCLPAGCRVARPPGRGGGPSVDLFGQAINGRLRCAVAVG